jgi:hypothetical protein
MHFVTNYDLTGFRQSATAEAVTVQKVPFALLMLSFFFVDVSGLFKKLQDGIKTVALKDHVAAATALHNKAQTLLPETALIRPDSQYAFIKNFLAFVKSFYDKSAVAVDKSSQSVLRTIVVEHIVPSIEMFKLQLALAQADIDSATWSQFLDGYLKANATKGVLTYIKLRLNQDDTEVNQRFKVWMGPRVDDAPLLVQYRDDDLQYYNENGSASLTAFKAGDERKNFDFRNSDFTVLNYDHNYVFGPFTRLFKDTDNNGAVASRLYEIETALRKGQNVLVIGYGASGAGKTSTLIFHKLDLKDGKLSGNPGILSILCNKIGADTAKWQNLIVRAYEFRGGAVGHMNIRGPQGDGGGGVGFTYENNSFQLDKPYNHTNEYATDDEGGKIETKSFDKGESMGAVLSYIIDTDRYVKATPNNPNSSRSHALIFIKFTGGPTLIIGDFAGVENKFDCNDTGTALSFLTRELDKDAKHRMFYSSRVQAGADRPQCNAPAQPLQQSSSKHQGQAGGSLSSVEDPSVIPYMFGISTRRRYHNSIASKPDLYWDLPGFPVADNAPMVYLLEMQAPILRAMVGNDDPNKSPTPVNFANGVHTIVSNIISKANDAEYFSKAKSQFFRSISDAARLVSLCKRLADAMPDTTLREQAQKNFEQINDIMLTISSDNSATTAYRSAADALIKVIRELKPPAAPQLQVWVNIHTKDEFDKKLADARKNEKGTTPPSVVNGNCFSFEPSVATTNSEKEAAAFVKTNLKKLLTALTEDNIAKIQTLFDQHSSGNNGHNIFVGEMKSDIWKVTFRSIDPDILFKFGCQPGHRDCDKRSMQLLFPVYHRAVNVVQSDRSKTQADTDLKILEEEHKRKLNAYEAGLASDKKELVTETYVGALSKFTNPIDESDPFYKYALHILRKPKQLAALFGLKLPVVPSNVHEYTILSLLKETCDDELDIDFETRTTSIMTAYDATVVLIKDIACRLPYAKHVCDARAADGGFINSSLAMVRGTIAKILKAKNADSMNIAPLYEPLCKETYCGTSDCFVDPPVPDINVDVDMFGTIQREIGAEKVNDLVLSVLCVLNLSPKANNPPPIPYIDINSLKAAVRTQNTEAFSQAHTEVQTRIDRLKAKTVDLMRNITVARFLNLKPPPPGATKSWYDTWQIANNFIGIIDNFNAASAIGTMEFMDIISKYSRTSAVCNLQEKQYETLVQRSHAQPLARLLGGGKNSQRRRR